MTEEQIRHGDARPQPTPGQLEHIVRFEKGFDCIHFKCRWAKESCKPGAGSSHGVYGLQIRFLVRGAHGAVQFLLSTGWLPKAVTANHLFVKPWDIPLSGSYPLPADLGYHANVPQYDNQPSRECEWMDDGKCYYDGSGLNAADAMYSLVNAGEDGLWAFLEGYYRCVFEGEEYPKPSEYPYEERKSRDHA